MGAEKDQSIQHFSFGFLDFGSRNTHLEVIWNSSTANKIQYDHQSVLKMLFKIKTCRYRHKFIRGSIVSINMHMKITEQYNSR